MKHFLYRIMYVVGISGLFYYGTQHDKSWWEFLLIGFLFYWIGKEVIVWLALEASNVEGRIDEVSTQLSEVDKRLSDMETQIHQLNRINKHK